MALSGDDLENINQILENALSGIRAGMVTKTELKTDLEQLESRLEARLASKTDLEQLEDRLASKNDLGRLEDRLVASMGIMERDAFTRLDEHERRIANLERKGAAA